MTELKLWERKISMMEYRVLELCGNILDGYQKRFDECERKVNSLNVPVSWPDYQIDRDGLHNSMMCLQLLLGENCLPRGCPIPRTLEIALRDSGVNEEDISAEIKRCRDYMQRAHELKERSLELGERAREVTRDVLREKRMRGETLTTEEKNALERVYEILSADH